MQNFAFKHSLGIQVFSDFVYYLFVGFVELISFDIISLMRFLFFVFVCDQEADRGIKFSTVT